MKSTCHPTSIATETLNRRPQQDDNAANEDQVNVPSHFFFQRDTDETPQQDVDTSQQLLILSNDVELNPGPVRYSCLIINSGQVP
ncbi:hypothetical protein DPMN_031953 [Dreissena polymorpha]|uniref:Uncharacterized protein n=1 Tax=Dreissena polymorpha TaxID=45954 RepID=A0A9D4RJT5_DREPO|nr:hypothetical protein DPMN_031953 [Dreissena polymorpha]